MSPDHATDSGVPQPPRTPRRGLRVAVAVLLIAAIGVLVFRTAWLCDDAYITLRTVDNFASGLGPRWNPHERVEGYTHPLWLAVLTVPYAFTREDYFTTIGTSMVVAMAAVVLLVGRRGDLGRTVFVAAVLLFSKSFMDYTTSGMENPLSYLLLAAFFGLYLTPGWTRRRVLALSAVAALVGLNRLDLLTIVVPPLLYAAAKVGWRKAVGPLVVGMLPLVVGELAALLYYGFLFPNTAYAKLQTGVTAGWLVRHAWAYYRNSLLVDPLTLGVIAAAMIAAVASRRGALVAVAVGMALYLLYIVRIGGDFMSGRFFSSLVGLAAVLVVTAIPARSAVWVVLVIVVVALGFVVGEPTITTGADFGRDLQETENFYGPDGIADERKVYYPCTGLLVALDGGPMPRGPWAEHGRARHAQPPEVEVRQSVGLVGYLAGPDQVTIDLCALTDPLLARLPTVFTRGGGRIGHYVRALPPGYLDSVRTGTNRIADPNLAEYYDRLCLVTRGPLLSRDRLVEILRFQLGLNDHLLEAYTAIPPVDVTPQAVNAAEGGVTFGHAGVEVHFAETCHDNAVEVRLPYGSYAFIPSRGGRGIDSTCIWAEPRDGRVATWRISIPWRQAERGYDSLLIEPLLEPPPHRLVSVELLGEIARRHAAEGASSRASSTGG